MPEYISDEQMQYFRALDGRNRIALEQQQQAAKQYSAQVGGFVKVGEKAKGVDDFNKSATTFAQGHANPEEIGVSTQLMMAAGDDGIAFMHEIGQNPDKAKAWASKPLNERASEFYNWRANRSPYGHVQTRSTDWTAKAEGKEKLPWWEINDDEAANEAFTDHMEARAKFLKNRGY